MTENQSYKKCQSCAMSIKKDENKGLEANKTLSMKYCQFCYKDGEFIEPNITLKEMQEKCAEFFKIEHPVMSTLFGKKYITSIAKLERWTQ
ncbi:zinc ribbon domain-containing protein [Spiroplasma platyhelix]|uniref:Putative zinc ribbon domain-containing protein n=1 Tax=Spiroplasma platyhelix PALS-1 TaxID=1276218 RepID=A0A846U1A4_9MOLU|nr:zinc ribbon domain-containing protein [Spiroplasma platyhelix]MBE4704223.1 hypothetical protein [Spiroplasma platyhelix PALS-1]NKE38596.1 hypothetical protein [Spiroplasma platyhelix PALS-1]UJB28807.1 hypothetical protein SPLAT_v1c00400 [Spiroplasma platyhelix PALS-1]